MEIVICLSIKFAYWCHLTHRIAIAGTIGTGLFLGSGTAIARAGPLGALLAYMFIGSISYSMLCSVGEMTCFAPVSGSFPHFGVFGHLARWAVHRAHATKISSMLSCKMG